MVEVPGLQFTVTLIRLFAGSVLCCLGEFGGVGRRKEDSRLIERLKPGCYWSGVGEGIGAEVYTVFDVGE